MTLLMAENAPLIRPEGFDRRIRPALNLRPSRHDIVVAALSTTTVVSVSALMFAVAVWIGNKPERTRLADVSLLPSVMIDGDGGWEDGTLGASPNVESPEDPSLDPSLALESTSDVTELMGITETVEAFSDVLSGNAEFATTINEEGFGSFAGVANDYTGLKNSGIPGSAEGTGGRPLGSGGPGRGGRKREQRWIIEFGDTVDLNTYASQLNHFGIELAAKFDQEERLVYLSNLTDPRPAVREVSAIDARGEKRMFMSWAEGSEARRIADEELFRRAGVDVSQAQLLHFYPMETELMLATLEQDFLKRPAQEIRQTAFSIRRVGAGFEFFVVSQR